uniref:alpha/beta fold hydrolase n=1 Tax=Trichocoleus desertorum TaxID=1481672 RepID=UPI0025B4E5D4|nr:alpha/beta hydrolase [Trichocoleus desertorum]
MSLPLRNSRLKLSQGQIFWREIGQGDALVFLHGSWSDSSQWVPVLEQLGTEYHCFAPDLLGVGESERPNVHYSIELQVETLAEYLESLRLRQVYLIGHSLGAWVAASYALKYLDQVRGLVLLAPEGIQVQKVGRRWWWAKLLIARPPLLFWLLRSLQPFAPLLGLQKRVGRTLQWRKQLLQSPVACRLLFQRRRAEIQAEQLQGRLDWLKVPVTVLQSEQDAFAAKLLSQTYAELTPTANWRIVPQGGEELPLTAPAAVAQEIREFVSPT